MPDAARAGTDRRRWLGPFLATKEEVCALPPFPWRRRRLAEPEASAPLEPDPEALEAGDRLGSPEAEVGSPPAGRRGPQEGVGSGHRRDDRSEEAQP